MSERTYAENDSDEVVIDLGELFFVILSKLWLIIALFIVGVVASGLVTKFAITPKYSSASQIFILTQTTSVTSLADIQMGEQLTVDFEILAKSRPVVEAVIDELNLDMTYEELVGIITTENPNNTRILKLYVEHPDAQMACDVANALADATAEQVANVMDTDRPNVVERAVVAKNPSSPSLLKNIAIGGLAGISLALLIVILGYVLDDTIKTEEDVQRYLDLHTLASLPVEKGR